MAAWILDWQFWKKIWKYVGFRESPADRHRMKLLNSMSKLYWKTVSLLDWIVSFHWMFIGISGSLDDARVLVTRTGPVCKEHALWISTWMILFHKKMPQKNIQRKTHIEAKAVSRRPVHAAITQTHIRPSLPTSHQVNVRPKWAATTQTDACPVISQKKKKHTNGSYSQFTPEQNPLQLYYGNYAKAEWYHCIVGSIKFSICFASDKHSCVWWWSFSV